MSGERTEESGSVLARLARAPGWAEAACLVLACAVYLGGLGNYFVGDDFPWVTHSVKMFHHPLPALAERYTWSGSCVLFALDLALWGTEPLGYNLTNLVLHVGCTALVGRLALALTRRRSASLLAMLLFGTSAAGAEAVLWKTGRGHELVLLLLLAAVLGYLRWREDGRRSALWIGLAAAAAAHFTLFNAVVLLPLLFVLVAVREPGTGLAPVRAWLRLWPFAATSLAYLVLYTSVRTTLSTSAYYEFGWHLVTSFGVYLLHLFSLVTDLLPAALGAGQTSPLVGALAALGFAAALVLVRHPAGRFALAWIAITLLPYLPVPMPGGFQPSRYRYLPFAGVALLLGWALSARIERLSGPSRVQRFGAAAVALAVAVVVIVNVRLVRQHARDFGDVGDAHAALVAATAPTLAATPLDRLIVVEDRSQLNLPVALADRLRLRHGLFVRGGAPWRMVYIEDLFTLAIQERAPGDLFVRIEPEVAGPEIAAGGAVQLTFTDRGLEPGGSPPASLIPWLSSSTRRSPVSALRVESPGFFPRRR